MGLGIGFRVGPVYYRQRITGRRGGVGCMGCIVWPIQLLIWLLLLECVAIAAMCVYTVLIYGWMISVATALIVSAVSREPVEPTVRRYQAWVGRGFHGFHRGVGRMFGRRR